MGAPSPTTFGMLAITQANILSANERGGTYSDLKADPTEMKSVCDEKGYEKVRERLTSSSNRLRKHYEAPEFD